MADKKITELAELTTPVDADIAPIVDDPAGAAETKKITWANIKATLKTYFDTLYEVLGACLKNVVEDATPELGGELDAKTNKIVNLGAPGAAADAARKSEVDAKIGNVVEDASPQLGGDLDLYERQIQLRFEPGVNLTASGLIISVTVDTNAEGIGAPLFMAADGHFDTANANSSNTAPAVVLALESGTGVKKVLVHGILRNDTWNFATGPGETGLIYLNTTTGTLTQGQPSGTDDVIQPVGWALSDDCIYFCPSLIYFTHT